MLYITSKINYPQYYHNIVFAKVQTWDLVKIKRPAVHSLPGLPRKKKLLPIIFYYISNRNTPIAFARNLHTNQTQSEKESILNHPEVPKVRLQKALVSSLSFSLSLSLSPGELLFEGGKKGEGGVHPQEDRCDLK